MFFSMADRPDPEYDCNLDSVHVLTLVRKSFNLRGNDCKTSLLDQNNKRILWTTDLLNFYNLSNSSTSVFLFQILS